MKEKHEEEQPYMSDKLVAFNLQRIYHHLPRRSDAAWSLEQRVRHPVRNLRAGGWL